MIASFIYEIQEELYGATKNFYVEPDYDQSTLTVTNTGIWVSSDELPEHMIIINKIIINKNNQIATSRDFNKIKLNINEKQPFQIILKELNKTIVNKGTYLEEVYTSYSGNVYNGLVTKDNQLIFKNIPAGKYEISENAIQYFEFIGIEEINKSENASIVQENNNYYIIISSLHENNEYIEIKITNKIDDSRVYDDTSYKENLFKHII